MITKPENTNTVKEVPQKQNRFWIKLSLALAIILIIVWLIPYFFSNFLFNTTIKKTFSKLTNQEYTLTFDNLKINLLTREATFFGFEIIKTEKNTLHSPLVIFNSDRFLFSKLNIRALQKNQILKFEKIEVNKLKLKIENEQSTLKNKKLSNPLSSYLSQLEISIFSVQEAEIVYKQANDSIYIPSLSLELNHLRIDSLRDTVKTNRFHFVDIDLDLKKQQIIVPDKSHQISLSRLKFSSKEKLFQLDSLYIAPFHTTNSNNTYSLDIPQFSLKNFQFDSLINQKEFLAQYLNLDINYLNIQIKPDSNSNHNSTINKQLSDLINKHLNKIHIQNTEVKIAKSQINFLKHQQINFDGNCKFQVNNLTFYPKEQRHFSLTDGEVLLPNFTFSDTLNHQNLQFNLAQLNFQQKTFNLTGINFVSGKKKDSRFQLEEIQLNMVDWIQLLNSNKLIADNLILKKGNFTQTHPLKSKLSIKKIENLNNSLLSFFNLIKIKTIQFQDWNYHLLSKAIQAKNIDAQLNSFQVPNDSKLAFGLFSDFSSQINRFSWVSDDQRHHYLANAIAINSQSQEITIQKVQSFPRWKTLNNEPLNENAHFKIFAEHIKIKTKKPFYQIRLKDTLALSHLSIDSLSLKQFGKHISETKLKANIPPIRISSFELITGNFAAYNDSSIINRLAQVNGIHLQGDFLEIFSDSLFRINYRHLIAVTKKGFYQNEAQGLNFNFKKIDFDSKDESIGFQEFKVDINSKKNGKSIHHQLNSKLVKITGFDHNLFFQSNLISAKEFKINAPTIISKHNSDKKQHVDFQQFFSLENLQQLPYVEFDRFIIHDFTWLSTYTIKGITNITTLEKANFEALDFRLSYRSFINPERIFFSNSIDFYIGNFKKHFQNGKYLLMVKDIGFSSLKKQLNFDNIQFYTLQKANQNNYNFTIDRVSFNKINFADFQHNFSLSVDNILIQKPNTKLRFFGFDENSTVKNLNTLDLYPLLKTYFSALTFNTIDLRDMTLKLDVLKGNSTNIYNLGHLNLQMHDFKIDSITGAFQNNRFFYTRNTLVHLRNYSAQIANEMYRLNFADLRLSTLSGMMDIDSVSLQPLYNYADFAKQMQYQSDRFDITVHNIRLSGIDFQDAMFRNKYTIRRADINQLIGEASRDGVIPRRPNYYPPNPIQRLLNLPYFIQVDSLLLNDSHFAYKEKGEHTEEYGYIYFDKLNALILKVSNNPDYIKFGGNTVLNAQAMLMGKSKLNLDATFPLLDQGKSFKLNAQLERIEIDYLEPILKPLALIRARSGTIESVDLSVEANDDYAFGYMKMLYYDLKVDVLNKSMKKGFFSTLFANAMIKTENINYLFPRNGPIYFERNKDRSLFNYWAEISILGMKTSMGLADKRIAKKVKKLKED